MKEIVVSIDYNAWDDYRIVKLVHNAGRFSSDINIKSGDRDVNMKSISTMMDYFGKFHPSNEMEIRFEGESENDDAMWFVDYFQKNLNTSLEYNRF